MPTWLPDFGNVRFIFDKQFTHFIAIIVEKNFVQTVRAVELVLGILVPGISSPPSPSLDAVKNVTSAFAIASTLSSISTNPEVQQVLKDAALIFEQVAKQLGLNTTFAQGGLGWLSRRSASVTKYVISPPGRGFCWWFVTGLCYSVSWMSAGSTTPPQTQPMQLLALKPMTTIYIIRMYKPSKFAFLKVSKPCTYLNPWIRTLRLISWVSCSRVILSRVDKMFLLPVLSAWSTAILSLMPASLFLTAFVSVHAHGVDFSDFSDHPLWCVPGPAGWPQVQWYHLVALRLRVQDLPSSKRELLLFWSFFTWYKNLYFSRIHVR